MIGTPATLSTTMNGGTTVDIIPSPSTGQQHIAQRISLYNADTAAVTVTVRLYDGSNHNPIEKQATIASGATATFTHCAGHCADGTTKKFTAIMSGAPATTNPVITASYIVNQ